MDEWFKSHAWKACNGRKPFGGSNPPLSARTSSKASNDGYFFAKAPHKHWVFGD